MATLLRFFTFTNVNEADKENYLVDDELKDRVIRGDEIIKREKIEGSPFTIVQKSDETFVALGMYKVTQNLTYKQCYSSIKDRDWGLIMNVCRLIAMDEIAVAKETKEALKKEAFKMNTNGQPKSNKYK